MTVRPIDAVQVLNDINWHHKPTPVSEFESGFNQGLNQAMWIITHAPTLTPPNEPLTLEQLREMDGEPVWAVLIDEKYKDLDGWYLVHHGSAYLARIDDWELDAEEYGVGWLAYRRPPEGEKNESARIYPTQDAQSRKATRRGIKDHKTG